MEPNEMRLDVRPAHDPSTGSRVQRVTVTFELDDDQILDAMGTTMRSAKSGLETLVKATVVDSELTTVDYQPIGFQPANPFLPIARYH